MKDNYVPLVTIESQIEGHMENSIVAVMVGKLSADSPKSASLRRKKVKQCR